MDVIISVGYRVKSQRGTQFRIWANSVLKEYIIKGFTMDDERLKGNGGGNYWKELLDRIRDIRSSEKVLYRQVLDLYATSVDYNPKSDESIQFFKIVQNKLHYAAHGHTAAEVIYERADAEKEHMGLTTWKDAPNGKIQEFDVVVAKNYLTEKELGSMSRIVNAYLDFAEDMADRKIPMTMEDWASHLDDVLSMSRYELLHDAGKISAKIAEKHALTEFQKYRVKQDRLYESDFDRFLLDDQE